MSHLIVKGPEGQKSHSLELTEETPVLIGRKPDEQALGIPLPGGGGPVGHAVIDAPSVSSNHLAAWVEGGAVCLQDLGSRNGSWLKLPPGEAIRVASEEVVVQIARATREAVAGDEPPSPSWRIPSAFGEALQDVVEQWLVSLDVPADVALVHKLGEGPPPPHRIPLANGQALDVVPLATTDASWSRTFERLWRWVARQNGVFEAEQQTREEGMILASSAIRGAHRDVVAAAQSDARTLLLTGASGAGKEMLAEVFHRHGGRSGAFVAVNCAMFSKELLRSELFGAEPGSFTGASRRIIGAVERAQGGTLFLDEVGEMPPEVQPMLLRFLDRREFEQLGHYGKPRRADVRVVAATNRDLRDATRTGAFRADLWYRLSVHVVEVPSLRARWEDIETFLRSTQLSGPARTLYEALSPEALALLRSHAWEGNFRELTNFAERLPRTSSIAGISAPTCARALERGSLNPLARSAPSLASTVNANADWAQLAARAVRTFADDHGREPVSWDDQKEWNEKYLKPLIFFHLSGAAQQPRPTDEETMALLVSRSAARVKADRGTAAKQLARYFERYGE